MADQNTTRTDAETQAAIAALERKVDALIAGTGGPLFQGFQGQADFVRPAQHSGSDTFVFVGADRDLISDFVGSSGDRLNLNAIGTMVLKYNDQGSVDIRQARGTRTTDETAMLADIDRIIARLDEEVPQAIDAMDHLLAEIHDPKKRSAA